MRGHLNFLEHRAHVMLVTLPIGLLTGAVAFDLVALVTDRWSLAKAAGPMTAAGLLAAIPAVASGVMDWIGITAVTRAKRIGVLHAAVNLTGLGVLATSFFMRDEGAASSAVIVMSVLGLLVLCAGGWLGGELVERHRVGVADDAGLNAPGSLELVRRRRAAERASRTRPHDGARRSVSE